MSEDTSLLLVDEKIDVEGGGEPPLLPSLIKTKTAVACASRTSKLFVVSRNKVHMDRTFLLIALPTAKCCIDPVRMYGQDTQKICIILQYVCIVGVHSSSIIIAQHCTKLLYHQTLQSIWYKKISILMSYYFCLVDPSSPVVIILATGSEVRGFKPGRGRCIFSERKNPEYDFLRNLSKAVGPVS